MSDLGWRADGIERALAAGGVELETYRRPGFGGGIGVRRVPRDAGGATGFSVDFDPSPDDYEDEWPPRRRQRS